MPGARIGHVQAFGGASAPTNWLLCDGSFVSQATYAALFAIIGHVYNGGTDPGDGTFKLPDLRQRFPLGKAASGTGSTLGGTGGAIDHPHSGPSHTHPVDQPATHTAHAVTQPSAHTTLTHAGAAVTNHSAMTHTGFAITDHTISAEAATHPTHAAASHTHDAHTTAARRVAAAATRLTGPGTHSSVDAHTHDAHAAHTGSTITVHSIANADTHTADTHTVSAQPADHTSPGHSGADATGAHGHAGAATVAAGTGNTGTGNPPFQATPYIVRWAL